MISTQGQDGENVLVSLSLPVDFDSAVKLTDSCLQVLPMFVVYYLSSSGMMTSRLHLCMR